MIRFFIFLMCLSYRYLTSDSDLVIEKATEYDAGLFSCNATNIMGSSQKHFTLIIYGKLIHPSHKVRCACYFK